jgi:DNA-binding transcriptional regulator YbjK
VSYSLYQFNSFDELLRYIDAQIANLQKVISQLEQRYEAVKARAEKMRMIEKVLEDLMGEKLTTLNEIDYMGLKVVVNARAIDELNVLEETLESQKDTLESLTSVREAIYKLSSALSSSSEAEGLPIIVQMLNGIPVRILLKETE